MKAFLPRLRFASGLVGLTRNVWALRLLKSIAVLLVEGVDDPGLSSSLLFMSPLSAVEGDCPLVRTASAAFAASMIAWARSTLNFFRASRRSSRIFSAAAPTKEEPKMFSKK